MTRREAGVVLVLALEDGSFRYHFSQIAPENLTARRVRVRFMDIGLGQRQWTFTTSGFAVDPLDAEWFGSHRLLTRDCYDAIQRLTELLEFWKDGKEPQREHVVSETQCNRLYDFPEKPSS